MSIAVPCFRIEAEHGKEYAQYRVDSSHGSVWRRYREFAALAGSLQGLPSSQRCEKKKLPYLTGRMVRNPMAEENLEKRRGKLAVYLNEVAVVAASFPAMKALLDAFCRDQELISSAMSSTRPMVLTAESSDIVKDSAGLLPEDASSLVLLPKCRTCGKLVTPPEAEGGSDGEGSGAAKPTSAATGGAGGVGGSPEAGITYDTRAFCSVQCQRFFDAMQSKGFTISFVEGTRQIIPTPAPRVPLAVEGRHASVTALPVSPSLRAVAGKGEGPNGSPPAGPAGGLQDLPSLEALEAGPSHGSGAGRVGSLALGTDASPAGAPQAHPFIGRTKRPAGTGILAVFKQGGALGFGKSSMRMAGTKDAIAEAEQDSDADGEAAASPASSATGGRGGAGGPPAAAPAGDAAAPGLVPLTGILAYCPVTNAVRTAAHQRALKGAAAANAVVFTGEAWKRGAGLKNWKLRRFELRDRSLYYYRTSRVKLLGKLHMYVSPPPHALLAAAAALVDKGYDPADPAFEALLFAVPFEGCFFAQLTELLPAEAEKLGLPSQLAGKKVLVAAGAAAAASSGAAAVASSSRQMLPSGAPAAGSAAGTSVTSPSAAPAPGMVEVQQGPWVMCLSTPERTLYLSFEKAEAHAEWHKVLSGFVDAERHRLLALVRGHFKQMSRPFSERLELALAASPEAVKRFSLHPHAHALHPVHHHHHHHSHGAHLGEAGDYPAPESPLLSESERSNMSLSRQGATRGMPGTHRGSSASATGSMDGGVHPGSASLADLDDAVAAAARAAAAAAVGLSTSMGSSSSGGLATAVGFPVGTSSNNLMGMSPAAFGSPIGEANAADLALSAATAASSPASSDGAGKAIGGTDASPGAVTPGGWPRTSLLRPSIETPTSSTAAQQLMLSSGSMPRPSDLPDLLQTAALAASLVSPMPSMGMPSATRGLSQAAASIAAASSRSFMKAGSFSGITALQHAFGVTSNAWEISEEEIEVVDRIGSGSFGDVYRGRLFGTEVAVKLITSPTAVSTEALDSLKTEVAILSSLRHPNVVLYLGAQTTPPNIFIVTEWCERGSLSSLLYDRTVPLSSAARLGMALQTAQGMCYLHAPRRKIIHRDLKSSNLLVTRDFTVKVADFGLTIMRNQGIKANRGGETAAKALGGAAAAPGAAAVGAKGVTPAAGRRLSRSGSVDLSGVHTEGVLGQGAAAASGSTGASSTSTANSAAAGASKSSDEGEEYGVVGSPQFMAPEVLEGQPYNGSVDVYSFGIVMCEIAARILPYSDRYKRFDFMDAVLEEGAVPTIPRWCGDLKRPRVKAKGSIGGGGPDEDSGDESWAPSDDVEEEEEDESVIQPNGLPFGWKEDLEQMMALPSPPSGLLPAQPPLLAGFPLRSADIPAHLADPSSAAPASATPAPLGGIAEWRIQRGDCTGILQKLIIACLDRDPDRRPSFEELVDLLRALLDRPPHDVFMQLELPRLREALAYGDDIDASVAANEIVHFASHSLLRSIPVILSGTGVTIQAGGAQGFDAGKERSGSSSSGGGRSLNVKLDTTATSFFPLLPFAPLPSPSQSQMNATPYVSLETVTQAGPELVAALVARLRHNDLFLRPRIGIPLYCPDLSTAMAYGPAGTTLVVVRDHDPGVPARTAVLVKGFEHPAWRLPAPAAGATPGPAGASGQSPAVVAGGTARPVMSAAARMASREAAVKEKEDKAKLAACIASSSQAVHALRVLLQVMGAVAPAPTSLAEDSGLEFASADDVAGHLPPASSIDRLLLKHASRLVYALATVAVGSALSPTEHAFVTRPTGGVSLYSYRPVTPLPDLPDFGTEATATAAALLRELWTSLPLLRTAIAHVVTVTSLAATLRYTALQVFVEPTTGGGFTVNVAEDVIQARVYGSLLARLHGGTIASHAAVSTAEPAAAPGAGVPPSAAPAAPGSSTPSLTGAGGPRAALASPAPATPVAGAGGAPASAGRRVGGTVLRSTTAASTAATPTSRGGFPVARLALGSPTAAAGAASPAPLQPLQVEDLASSEGFGCTSTPTPPAVAAPAVHPLVAAVQSRIQGAVIERVDGIVLGGGIDIEDYDPTLV